MPSGYFRNGMHILTWGQVVGKRYIDIILIDIFKSYDCLSHDLLIAKLEAYELDIGSLNTLLDCLSLKERRTKVGLIHCQKI